MSKIREHWQWIFIAIAIIISLYMRILNPWNSVFIPWMEGARLSGNDPWYYYRLIDGCIHNFPSKLWFDAFTNYPYGTYVHFGPFLVYLGTILSEAFSATDPVSIRNVIVFIPAIAGTLLVFPVYLFVKEVFDKRTSIIALLLVIIIPGQLLHRTVLSFNDHNSWEPFWMITTLGMYVYAVNVWSSYEARENLKNLKRLAIPILAGISLGMYLDTWGPGFIAALLIVAFVFLSFLLKRYLTVNPENTAYVSVITFLVASLVYLPFAFRYPGLSVVKYSPFQLLVLLGCTVLVSGFYIIVLLGERGYYDKKVKGECITGVGLVAFVFVMIGALFLIFPGFFNLLARIISVVQPKGGALTVAEVQPFFIQNGEFSLANAWFHFSMTFFFAIPGMIYTIYLLIRQRKPLYLLALVWGFAMLIALAGQNRFAYYFGVVTAVFAAVMLDVLLRHFKFYDLITAAINKEDAFKKVGYTKPIIAILLIIILFYPTMADANYQSKYSAGGINKQWYDALTWMRNNTPGKEIYDQFYYELYKPNPDMKKPYLYYPEGVYGVMSWWDYGHWITAIAHRIPNANPFQQGIGNKYNHVPGAAPFFTAYNESEANAIADKLGVKYVISDVEMATGKFQAMAVWAEGDFTRAKVYYLKNPAPDPSFRDKYLWYVYITSDGRLGIAKNRYELPRNTIRAFGMYIPSINYFKTMEAKLHIMDGSGLQHYRMVYESAAESKTSLTIEMLYRYIYDSAYAKDHDYVHVRSTGYVKVFEYVKGVKITGKVSNSVKEVVISANITTNQNRTFVYKQVSKVVGGKYEFVAPYAQDTTYPVKASEYKITAGKETRTISPLSDKDLENGKVVVVDFV